MTVIEITMLLIFFTKFFFRLKNSHLIAFGRSLGGAVAISLAEKYPEIIKAVIVENTFLSVGKKLTYYIESHFHNIIIIIFKL